MPGGRPIVISVVRSARARVFTFWGARYLGNGFELCEQTSAAHTTWCALCAAEVCSRNSKPFSRNRAPHRVTSRFVGFVYPVSCVDALHVDQEHDPTLMLERALNGAHSCNHSSKAGAIVHRVIRDNTGVCQRDSSHAIDRTQLQCCHRERCVSIVEVIGQVVVSEYVSSARLFRRRCECSPI